MHRPLRPPIILNRAFLGLTLVLFGACLGLSGFAQRRPTRANASGAIVDATKKFLATLDGAQRGKLLFHFKDDAQRKRWSNWPSPMFRREGLRIGDLTTRSTATPQ